MEKVNPPEMAGLLFQNQTEFKIGYSIPFTPSLSPLHFLKRIPNPNVENGVVGTGATE